MYMANDSIAVKCKSKGKLKEYVGSKIDIERQSNDLAMVKFMQPVLVQKLGDEYMVPDVRVPKTHTVAGQVSVRGDYSAIDGNLEAMVYRLGTATMMFMTQWIRPDVYNAVRGLARHSMYVPRLSNIRAIETGMKYIVEE